MAPPALPRHLEQISGLLGQMCTEAATGLRGATAGLLDGRVRLAEKIVAGGPMAELQVRLEQVATDALLFHAPVAGDLRIVVSAIRSSADLERMGVLARHVAKVALRRRPACAVPEQVRPVFAEMSRLGVEMALKTAEVVRTRNVVLAVELDADDEAMDALHAGMFGVLMDRSWPHGVASAVDVTLLARYYERFADHTVVVAEETVTAVTGRQPREVVEFLHARGDVIGPLPAG